MSDFLTLYSLKGIALFSCENIEYFLCAYSRKWKLFLGHWPFWIHNLMLTHAMTTLSADWGSC